MDISWWIQTQPGCLWPRRTRGMESEHADPFSPSLFFPLCPFSLTLCLIPYRARTQSSSNHCTQSLHAHAFVKAGFCGSEKQSPVSIILVHNRNKHTINHTQYVHCSAVLVCVCVCVWVGACRRKCYRHATDAKDGEAMILMQYLFQQKHH